MGHRRLVLRRSLAYWLRVAIPGDTEVIELNGAELFFPDERGAALAAHLRRYWAAAT